MGKIAIVYWSGTGNTQAMAELVAEGARAAGASPELFTAVQFSAEKAKEYTALALGCPSMGAEQLEETEFEPLYQRLKPVLGGKGVPPAGGKAGPELNKKGAGELLPRFFTVRPRPAGICRSASCFLRTAPCSRTVPYSKQTGPSWFPPHFSR